MKLLISMLMLTNLTMDHLIIPYYTSGRAGSDYVCYTWPILCDSLIMSGFTLPILCDLTWPNDCSSKHANGQCISRSYSQGASITTIVKLISSNIHKLIIQIGSDETLDFYVHVEGILTDFIRRALSKVSKFEFSSTLSSTFPQRN